jgi:hypothetical protein
MMFEAALAAAFALAAPAAEAEWTSDRTLERLTTSARKLCKMDVANAGFLVESLAGLSERQLCPQRPDLAFQLATALAGNRWSAAQGHRLLATLHRQGLGTPHNESLADEHLRQTWLLVSPGLMERPFADPAEASRWLARDETISFLRRHKDPARFAGVGARLAQALLARRGSGDEAEAVSILAEPAVALSDVAQLLRAQRDLQAPEEARRAAALHEIRRAAISSYAGGEASELIAELGRRRLAAAVTPVERQDAIALLADAAFASGSTYRATFFEAVRAANGGKAPGALTGELPTALRAQILPKLAGIDFPPAALRAEEQGTITLRGLVDPAGRVIFTEPLTAEQPPNLVAGLRRHFALRPIRVDLGAARTAGYVWVVLPSVGFTVPDE